MTSGGQERFVKKFGENLNELNADVNVVFNKKKREFYDYYAKNLALMERVRQSYANLIFLMTSNLQSGPPKIGSRIKDRSECIAKFERNYRTKAEKEKRDKYEISSYITDFIGVRVVCLYEDDVNLVRDIIEKNFKILEVTDKTKILEEDHERFGYKGLHLDIQLDKSREKLPEYDGFDGFQVEIQVRSIVQDAWSEVDHRLKYKKSIPDRLKRKIIRIAALFELADQEFTYIRKDTELLESLLSADSPLSPARKIDSFTFIAAMKKHFDNYNFDNEPESDSARKIDGFVAEVLSMDRDLTDEKFSNLMDEYIPRVDNFKSWKMENGAYRLNPFTITRHILYLYDKNSYHDLLFEAQRKAFDSWLVKAEKA